MTEQTISLITYDNHGGTQALIAFKLVVKGLKMQELS